MDEWVGTALIATFGSSERSVKPSVVLNSGIPGQTGCLHGDGQGGERVPPFVDETGCWKWIRSDRSAPRATRPTAAAEGLGILQSGKEIRGGGGVIQRVKGHHMDGHGHTAYTVGQRGGQL